MTTKPTYKTQAAQAPKRSYADESYYTGDSYEVRAYGVRPWALFLLNRFLLLAIPAALVWVIWWRTHDAPAAYCGIALLCLGFLYRLFRAF